MSRERELQGAMAQLTARVEDRRLGAIVDRATYGAEMLARYLELDALLVARGWPATSPWWIAVVRRYFAAPQNRVVLRVGRRGGKSTTLCRIAVVEAVWGRHDVPPGDTGFVGVISVDRKEAGGRLRTITAILDVLGEPHRPIDGGIALVRHRTGFRVYTASIAGVSGPTYIMVIGDEVAKWRDADTGVNPAKEVIASAMPGLATMRLGKMVLSSSPLGQLDAHAAAFTRGETDAQLVFHATTWQANPTLTEADTHRLEPDHGKWLREYAAVPLEGDEESLLAAASLDRCTRAEPTVLPPEPGVFYVATMDPGFTSNAWTFAICGMRRYLTQAGEKLRRAVCLAREWRGTTTTPLEPRDILSQIALAAAPYGLTTVYSDRYERFGLASIGRELGLTVSVPDWSASEKLAAAEQLETLAADSGLDIPAIAQLRADLLSVRKKLTPNGFTIQIPTTPDGRHADYWPTVLLGLHKANVEPSRVVRPDEGSQAWWDMIEADERAWRQKADENWVQRAAAEAGFGDLSADTDLQRFRAHRNAIRAGGGPGRQAAVPSNRTVQVARLREERQERARAGWEPEDDWYPEGER